MKVKVISVTGTQDASFEGKDGQTISGQLIKCKVTVDGKAGVMPITAYGKLAEKIVGGVEVEISKRTDKQGNKIFTAKKDDNMHLLPDAKPWTGGKGGGGGMSEADIIFLAAVSIWDRDPANFAQAIEEATALRQESNATPFDRPVDTTGSQEDTDDIPF